MEEKKGINKYILINFRPLFCMFIGMIIGSFIIYWISMNLQTYLFSIILTAVLGIVVVAIILIKFVKLKAIKTTLKFVLVISLGIILSMICLNARLVKLTSNVIDDGEYEISGRVEEIVNYETYSSVILENVKLNDTNYNFKIQLSINSNQTNNYNLDVGSKIQCVVELSQKKLFTGLSVNNKLIENIRYSTSLKSVIDITSGNKHLDEVVKEKINNSLKSNMNSSFASLSFSLLFGDKSELDSDVYTLFKECGIAHILAASGLHVALISAILIFILKKFKLNKIANLIIVSMFLLFYSLLCGFTASVCRASIMSIVYLIADLIGQRKDMLSTFSLAGIIILLISPLQVFTVGFALSFGCVIGIILLAKPLDEIFSKLRLPNFIKQGLIITFSSSIATLPFVATVFGVFYPVSLLSNLIILPLFTMSFTCLFVFTVINLILPFGFLYGIVSHLFNVIISLCGLFSMVGGINLKEFSSLATILYFLMLFIVSQFVNLPLSLKTAICSLLIVVIIVCFVLGNYNTKYNQNIIFSNQVSNFNVLTTENDNNYILNVGSSGTDYEYYKIRNTLYYRGIVKIDAVILTAFDTKSQNNLIKLVEEFKINKLIFDSSVDSDLLDGVKYYFDKEVEIYDFENEYHLDNISISTISYNNIKFALKVKNFDKLYIIISKDLTTNRINKIKEYQYENIITNENDSLYFDNVYINKSFNEEYAIKLGV